MFLPSNEWKHFCILVGPPRSGIGTYEFTLVRSFVRPSVRSFFRTRSQNPFIGLFWFLAQSCSIISIGNIFAFSQKSRFRHFGTKSAKKLPFWPKTLILTIFSKSVHRISLVLHVQTTFMGVYYYNYPVKVLTKIFLALFWPFFLPKFVRFDQKIDILANFSQSVHTISLVAYLNNISGLLL